MSMFGDSRNHMNYLYDELKDFFENGGTLKELFEVLEWYFKLKEEQVNISEEIKTYTDTNWEDLLEYNGMTWINIDRFKSLQQKVEQLEKENIKQKEIIESLTTMTVFGDKKQIKNTAQCKLEQLENIRKEVIEELSYMSTDDYVEDYDIREKHYNLLMNILNKGE